METLFKHLAGTEHDHDQSSHARGGGSGSVTLTADRILDGRFAFDGIRTKMGLDAGGFKNRNATDIAERLKDAGADPDDLLALVVNKSVLSTSELPYLVQESAITVGEVPVPERPAPPISQDGNNQAEYLESVASVRAIMAERSEALEENYKALHETLLSGSLPDDVTVLAVKDSTVDGTFSEIVLTRDPNRYASDFDTTTTLRFNGQWSDNAVTVLGYYAANNTMKNWARSAQGAEADAFAAAVKEELGIAVESRQSLNNFLSVDVSDNPYYQPAGPAHEARKALARAMYENTQEQLKTFFPNQDSFVVYRGANHGGFLNSLRTAIDGTEITQSVSRLDSNPNFPWRESDGQTVSVAMYENNYKPLSSWSLNRNTAAEFALQTNDFVAATVVPRERVFSTAFTGNGAFNESEFVVLGGKLNIAVQSRINERFPAGTAHPSFVQDTTNFDAYLRARFANDALSADSFITIDGQPVPVFKHLAGTEHDHDQSSHARGGSSDSGYASREPNLKQMTGEEFAAWAKSMGVTSLDFSEVVLTDNLISTNVFASARQDVIEGLVQATEYAENPSEVVGDYVWQEAVKGLAEKYDVSPEDIADPEYRDGSYYSEAVEVAVLLYSIPTNNKFRSMVIEQMRDYMNEEDFDKVFHRALDRVDAKKMAQKNVADGMAKADLSNKELSDALDTIYRGVYRNPSRSDISLALDANPESLVRVREVSGGLEVEHWNADSASYFRPERSKRDYAFGSADDPDVQAAVREAARLGIARELIAEWAKTSNKTPIAAAIQRAAAAEFGLTSAAEPVYHEPIKSLESVTRPFVRAQYEATQKMLAEQFPDVTHFTLFRGGDSESRYSDIGGISDGVGFQEATLVNRPLASFSTSAAEANLFTGGSGTFVAAVPKERIFSTPFTGNGALIEAEFVVLGGPIRGMRTSGPVYYDYEGPDLPSNLPMGATEFITVDGQPIPIGKSVVKHLAGTEFDHDQSAHARGGGSSSVGEYVAESLRRAESGRKLDVEALDIGTSLRGSKGDLAVIIKEQGWNKPAPMLNDDEFRAAYETGNFEIVYRAGPIGLEQGIVNGTPYIGDGLYGVGTYVTTATSHVAGYLNWQAGSIVPMLVPKSMLSNAPEASPHPNMSNIASQGVPASFTRNHIASQTAQPEYVIYNTSALLVGSPSEFPDGYRRPPGPDRPLEWARFEKADDGWEHGPYYALIDGEAVLVEFDGVAKHLAGTENDHDQQSHAGGGGSGRSELSDSEMQEIVYSSATVSEMYDKIADALGKTMRPTVAELDDSEVTLYRGLANFDRDVRQLLDGTVPETDLQTWGEGIYATSDREEAEIYGQVVRMRLDDSARIVDGEYEWSEAFTVDWPDSGPPTTSVFDISRIDERISISSLYNVYWASKGYDGYRPYGGYGEGETVLFNGEKLTVDRRDVGSDVVKHLAGTEFDHDQSSHAGGRTILADGARMSITETGDQQYSYQYGDFALTADMSEGMEAIATKALSEDWPQWEGNFAMRHLSAGMMGLPHPYAGGAEQFETYFADAVIDGKLSGDEEMNEAVKDFLSFHAGKTHAAVQSIADAEEGVIYGADAEGQMATRGMTIRLNRYDSHPILELWKGDTLDMPLSAFATRRYLSDEFIRGGGESQEFRASSEDFVFTPKWQSVMFELDMGSSKMRESEGSSEVVTQGKFRVVGTRDEERTFSNFMYDSDEREQTETMRIVRLQQTAVFNPRTGTYDALSGFVTLPDGRVVPVEDA